MNTPRRLLTAAILWLMASSAMAADVTTGNASKILSPVDLARYVGTWHEIARMPMYFQRKCARDVTANYSRDGDYIKVINRCVKNDGDVIEAIGRARVIDPPKNRHLMVGFLNIFGWWPFEGDYLILDIDPDYRWVIVGHPERKYGWILSRTPTMDADTRAHIDARLRAFGYDPASFINTVSSAR